MTEVQGDPSVDQNQVSHRGLLLEKIRIRRTGTHIAV